MPYKRQAVRAFMPAANLIMNIARSVAGVCVVRDAHDVIGLVCGHYLRIGFGHVAFIDDGSSDGTFEILSRLSRCDRRVSVKKVSGPLFAQEKLINERANELIAEGYAIIVPFDADELWNVIAKELETKYAKRQEVAFQGAWVNFVNQREAVEPKPAELFNIRYSAPPLHDADRVTVTGFKRPFVCCQEYLIAFKTKEQVKLNLGQHKLEQGPKLDDDRRYEVLHIPLRNKSEIVKRGLNYEPRRAGLRPALESSWQSIFHREVVLAGKVDEVWAANSADSSGVLDCYGEQLDLIPDERLQRCLKKSAAYLADRFGPTATHITTSEQD